MKIGDQVRLLSGSPDLTVLAEEYDKIPGTENQDHCDRPAVPGGHVAVGWFDGGTFIAAILPTFCLTPVPDADRT